LEIPKEPDNRAMSRQSFSYKFGAFRLDPFERLLLREGVPLTITPKVFDTLLALVENSGHMVEKDDLIKRIWPDAIVEEANLTVNISILRKALGEKYIETVPKHGYRFVAPVERLLDENVVLEERTRSHLVIEQEIETVPNLFTRAWRSPATKILAAVVVATVGLSVYYFVSRADSKEKAAAWTRETKSEEAYNAYLLGRYFFDRSGVAGAVEKSIGYYQQAIALDPGYARAYAGLADVYSLDLAFPQSPEKRLEAHNRVQSAVLKALELDDSLAEAHTSLARLRFYEWDWATAEKEYRRAIELDQSYSTARFLYGWYLQTVGRTNEGLAELYRAQQLEPLSININITIGASLTSLGQYDRAIEQLQKTVDLSPTSVWPHVRLAQAYEMKGEMNRSLEEFQKAIALSPEGTGTVGTPKIRLAQAYAFSGMKDEAMKILHEWNQGDKPRPQTYDIAVVYSGLGDHAKAFELLERVYEDKDLNLLNVRTDPRLVALRSDQRYATLMRRVGLSF
jgi:DNA-binding winged helix-turn-helix (wHTH) protein/lipopolysaccharide biosynthesis regulator YciM